MANFEKERSDLAQYWNHEATTWEQKSDSLLNRNDDAYERGEDVIKHLSDILEIEYIQSVASCLTEPSRDQLAAERQHWKPRGKFPKYLFRTLPHACGIFAVEDDVELVCVASMAPKTFTEYVNEKLGIEKGEALVMAEETRQITVPHMTLFKLGFPLPNNLDLKVVYLRVAPEYSLYDAEGHLLICRPGVAASEAMHSVHEEQALSCKIHHIRGQIYSTELLDSFVHFRRAYLLLRQWAYLCGIMSQGCNLLSESCLASLCGNMYLEIGRGATASPMLDMPLLHEMQRHSYFRQIGVHGVPYAIDSPVIPMLREIGSGVPEQHSVAIQGAFSCFAIDEKRMVAFKGMLSQFVNEYPVFFRIDARCWGPKLQSKHGQFEFRRSFQRLLQGFQTHLYETSERRIGLRIWPEIMIEWDSTEPSTPHISTYLLAIASTITDRNLNMQYCDGMSEWLIQNGGRYVDTTTSGYEITLLSQKKLKEQLGDEQHSKVMDPHKTLLRYLDFIPISIPRGEEASQFSEDLNLSEILAAMSSNNSHPRFRTAADAINRLCHDPFHAGADYEVGYEDRHLNDLVWKDIQKWTRDTQALDFVPMHRVRKIRQLISPNVWRVIWDREKRMDLTGTR